MSGLKNTPTDLRSLAIFMVGISVGICLMLIYMGFREKNVVITRIMIDPSAHVEDE